MTDPIRSALEAARTQIVNLNGALDDFWNDPERPSVAKMRSGTVTGLSVAQVDARVVLAQIDAALASLDAPQPDALREAGEALEPFDFYDFAPEDGWSDTDELEVHAPDGILLHCLKVGDIRRARSALRKAGGSND